MIVHVPFCSRALNSSVMVVRHSTNLLATVNEVGSSTGASFTVRRAFGGG
jgi:predicted SpoU family rRNA methylase